MQLLLDLQVLQSESRARGIGRYSRGLAKALLSASHGADAAVLLNPAVTRGLSERNRAVQAAGLKAAARPDDYWNELDELKRWVESVRPGTRVHSFNGLANVAGMLSAPAARMSAAELLYDAYVGLSGADVLHVPSVFDGFGDDTIVGTTDLMCSGPARAVTVYDLIPLEAPHIYLAEPTRERWYYHRLSALSKADLLLTISEHTRKEVLQLLKIAPDRVVSIGADADPIFQKHAISPSSRGALAARYAISKPFIMHVGILEARKNVELLVQAFAHLPAELRNEHQLLIVADATEKQKSDLISVAEKNGLDPKSLIFAGFVPDHDLVDLYGMTRVMVMPSLTEGFGLPVLEAMRCGAPVLASAATSLPEVAGHSELLFDPKSHAALSRKLRQILTDDGFRRFALEHCARQEKKFSWAQSASEALGAFVEAAERRKSQGRANGGKRKYVIVPPLELGDREPLEMIAKKLEASGDVIVVGSRKADRPAASSRYAVIEPDVVCAAPDQRVLVLAGAKGLDLLQQTIASCTPFAFVDCSEVASLSLSPEWRYLLDGYRRLLMPSQSGTATFSALQKAYPQAVGALSATSNADLPAEIESLYSKHPAAALLELLPYFRNSDPKLRNEVAAIIAENHSSPPRRRRLFLDVSELILRDAKSGIQRVVKNILRQILTIEAEFRVEPIYRDGDVYRYARKFTCEFLRVSPLRLPDAVIDLHSSDIFLGLDLDINISQKAADSLREFRSRGGSVNFLVHDLLPLTRPEWFSNDLAAAFAQWFSRITQAASRVIAVSRTVADEVLSLLEARSAPRAEGIELCWCHNGADDLADIPADPLFFQSGREDWASALLRVAGRPTFLTVGTIEPRKGISQLLDAADELWRDHDVNFVLVGKMGWLVDDLISRIQSHRELDRRLFWFRQMDDEALFGLYRMATAVVLPSEAEGFGLPLVEAARANTPILARDIAVFREIGGDGVDYFTAQSGSQLAAALKDWLARNAPVREAKPGKVQVLSWNEAAQNYLRAVRGARPYRKWDGKHDCMARPV